MDVPRWILKQVKKKLATLDIIEVLGEICI
jgi:hypothetical protein